MVEPYQNRTPQTHCFLGHAMEGSNVITVKTGYRRCRECLKRTKRRSARKRYWEKKAALNP